MQTVQIHSRIGADGVLKLSLPLGPQDANKDVVVTIRGIESSDSIARQQSWIEFIDATYGSCAGLGVERGAQGEYEIRESLDGSICLIRIPAYAT
jgi:hypothetical protein